jgi:translation initiation factor 1A
MSSAKPKGGKKHRRGKNVQQEDSKILTATIDQYYGKVTQLLGNSRVYLDVFIPKTEDIDHHVKPSQLGIIRGGIRKRTRLTPGSIVLVSLREFEKGNKVDILYSYNNEQVSKLKHKNLLPKSKIFENDGNDIQFEKDSDSDKEDFFPEQKTIFKESYSSNFNLIPDDAINYDDENDINEDTIDNL